VLHQDPVLSRVKLIAEPWDVGPDGYQVGGFPAGWSEWNGKYRDGIRDYWRGAPEALGDFGYRLTGSSDLYQASGRRPWASVNFVTSHDGFTLIDLVSYDEKHNQANGEENRDGHDDRSWNSGIEGPTDDPAVAALRNRRRGSLLATLLLSQGVPMLLGGDEIGRTQGGNNNAYCQDNQVSWYDWASADRDMLELVRRVVRLRLDHPVFRRRRWLRERPIDDRGTEDVVWYAPEGEGMSSDDWKVGYARSLAVFLNGAILSTDRRGGQIVDDDFLLMFNAHSQPLDFTIPAGLGEGRWEVVVDTGDPAAAPAPVEGGTVPVADLGLVVLRRPRPA
ncbi:MAG: glycogen debranching enzyme, partial [Acidimicrobiia bacterium]